MSDDIFDEVDVPTDGGFVSTRPSPPVPAVPRVRKDPHRSYELFDQRRRPPRARSADEDPEETADHDEDQSSSGFDESLFDEVADPDQRQERHDEEPLVDIHSGTARGSAHRESAFDEPGDFDDSDADEILAAASGHGEGAPLGDDEPHWGHGDEDDPGGPDEPGRSGPLERMRAMMPSARREREPSGGLDVVYDNAEPDPYTEDGMEDFAEFEQISDEYQRRGDRRRAVKTAVAWSGLIAVVGAGAGYAALQFLGSEAPDAEVEWASDVPGYSAGGQFGDLFAAGESYTIETAGTSSWFAAGIAEYDQESGEVTLYGLDDGEQLAEVEVDQFDYFVEFSHNGADVLGIRTAEGVTAIRDDGEVEDFEFTGSLSVNGSTPLVFTEDEETFVLDFDEGVEEFEINNDLNDVAADDATVYQVDPEAGQVVAAPVDEPSQAENVALQPVHETAEFVRFGGLGHGFAAVVWSTADGEYVGIHDLETGQPEEVLVVEGLDSWEVGRGAGVAVVDDYAVSLATGELMGHDPQMDSAYGPYPYTDDRRFFADGAHFEEDSEVLGATANTVFVRTPSGDVAAHDRQGATA